MKASEFKSIIKQLVIEEVEREVHRQVSKQLPKLLFEMLGQKPSVPQTLVKEDLVSDPDSTPVSKNVATYTNVPTPQKKVIKRYAKDPVLNAILNETTPGIPQSDVDEGVPLPNFSRIGVSNEFMGEMKEILNESNIGSVPSQPEEMIEETPPSSGPDLSKLFNKNFKAILEKSKKGHSGNFSGAIQNW